MTDGERDTATTGTPHRIGAAVAWSTALPVAALTVPVYINRRREVGTGVITSSGSETLVDVNGAQILWVLLVPLMVSLLVAGALLGGSLPGAVPLAWVLSVALLCATALAIFSVGILVLPVPIALLVACAARHTGSTRLRDAVTQPGNPGAPR